MLIPTLYAAFIPTMFSTGVTTLFLSATRQKFFSQHDTIVRNASKLGHNFKTLIVGTCGSFMMTPSFQEDKHFSLRDVLFYSLLIEFLWYSFHRYFHSSWWLYRNVHKLHHQSIVTMPVDAYIMSVPEVLDMLLLCSSAHDRRESVICACCNKFLCDSRTLGARCYTRIQVSRLPPSEPELQLWIFFATI